MAKYELEFEDEEAAHAFANQMDEVLEEGGMSGYLRKLIADARDSVRAQIPIPVPVKVGAVVTTTGAVHGGYQVFLRWATDNHTHSPWVEAGNHEQPYRTDEIGRITAVLSPGVDL